jgi:hypothetical protein
MDAFNPSIEELDAFAFAPGEWRNWQAAEWNQQLLLYCFVRHHGRQSSDPLRATLEDLPLLVRDGRADAEAMAQTLVQRLKWQARQDDRDPLRQLAADCKAQQRRASREPAFFAFLWLTCLIAHGYPDANAEGRFWDRFSRVFPKADTAYRFCIDQAWELLSNWLEDGQTFQGLPFSQLELPPVDTWQPHITHSWNLAFPSLRDRQLLQRALAPLRDEITPFQATNPALLERLLRQQQLSSELTQRLMALHQCLVAGKPPRARTVELLERELQHQQPDADSVAIHTSGQRGGLPPAKGYGPLLLRWMDFGIGVLLLNQPGQPVPPGLEETTESPWLPGELLLVPSEPDDPDFGPVDAGSLAIDPQVGLLPALRPLLSSGLLPFVLDPRFNLPRLVFDNSCGPISHALVRNDLVPDFLRLVTAEPVDASEEHWQCFAAIQSEGVDLWRFPQQQAPTHQEDAGRLSVCAGVPLQQGEGFLASGLGLPSVRVHGSMAALKVVGLTATGALIDFQLAKGQHSSGGTKLWEPVAAERQRADIKAGPARVVAFFRSAPTLERALTLSALPARVAFRCQEPLAHREHWGRHLGPLLLPAPSALAETPHADAISWARDFLNSRQIGVNQLFEEQMLDSLAALFQRRATIRRADFNQLHQTLLGQPEHWPRFADAVLRGWCEGGWIEEGVERRRGQWVIQPVDPRLVRLEGGRAQLVGLLPARGLVELLAHAHTLNMELEAVPPSCPHLPRGWRFTGRCDELAQRMGLQIVELNEWVEDPHSAAWLFEQCKDCDGFRWPSGLGFQMATERICGRRGPLYHVSPILKEGMRAPVSLRIDRESSRYGRRRWHSHSPNGGATFTSCHRNRVALHALLQATKGAWPFWVAERRLARIERLYDAEAYLPLPIGRYAALIGRRMPGPTRQKAHEHTYCYHVDETFLRIQDDTVNLPLTSF